MLLDMEVADKTTKERTFFLLRRSLRRCFSCFLCRRWRLIIVGIKFAFVSSARSTRSLRKKIDALHSLGMTSWRKAYDFTSTWVDGHNSKPLITNRQGRYGVYHIVFRDTTLFYPSFDTDMALAHDTSINGNETHLMQNVPSEWHR